MEGRGCRKLFNTLPVNRGHLVCPEFVMNQPHWGLWDSHHPGCLLWEGSSLRGQTSAVSNATCHFLSKSSACMRPPQIRYPTTEQGQMITESGCNKIKLFFTVNVFKSVPSNFRSIFNFSTKPLLMYLLGGIKVAYRYFLQGELQLGLLYFSLWLPI